MGPTIAWRAGAFSAVLHTVAPIRPQLMLKAIIGGPPWSAIVEGIPGQPGGIVITAGLTFDRIHIRAITRDTVVVQASDTTWKLTMKVNQ